MPGTGWQRRNPSGGGASRLPALLLTGLSGCLWPVVCLMRATQCQGGSRLAPGTGGREGGAGWCALGSGSLSARYQPPVEKLESSADTTGSAGMSGGGGADTINVVQNRRQITFATGKTRMTIDCILLNAPVLKTCLYKRFNE